MYEPEPERNSRGLARVLGSVLVALVPLQESGWERVEPGLELHYPADHGAHPGTRTEWWYLTGHLEDDAGARFGFQFTVFRRGLEREDAPQDASPLRARAAWAGHLALCDVARGETRFAERLRRSSPLAGAAPDDLRVHLEDWSLERVPRAAGAPGGDELRLSAADPARAFGLALDLRAEKPLVLHGESGYSRKGGEPGNASAYVSWTRLALEGSLELDGRKRSVRGSAWFDHEFGSSVLPQDAVGWDWFGLQLDDGRELMLFVLRGLDGQPLSTSAATLVAADGSARALAREDFSLRATRNWKSARTGAEYPAGWSLSIPGEALTLEIAPEVADCELVSKDSTGVVYWEGPVTVSGSSTGRGYAELTGYGSSLAGRF